MLSAVVAEYIGVRDPEYLQRGSYRGNAVIASYSVGRRRLYPKEVGQFRDIRGRSRQCYMMRQ